MTSHPNNPVDPEEELGPPSDLEELVEQLNRLWHTPGGQTPEGHSPKAPSAAAPSATPLIHAVAAGTTLGRFEIEGLVGSGAFGVVYAAYDPQLDRRVALKLPRPEVLLDAEKRERFATEASLAAALDHPGIVPIYEAELDTPTPHIVSGLCLGPDMAKWLAARLAKGREPIPWEQAANCMAQIAEAVEYAHGQGVFHRDLKPSNILLMPKEGVVGNEGELSEYEPRVTDFGLSKLADASLDVTRSSMLIGTPLYMAPEQIDGSPASNMAATDIYCLGVILFELLAGRPPIEGDSYVEVLDKLRNQTPTSLRLLRPEIPADLDRICQKCLARNPQARYATAEQLAFHLDDCAAGKPVKVEGLSISDRLDYWLRQEKRVTDAGWFAIWSQLIFVGWMIISVVPVTYWKSMSRADYLESLCDVLIATSTIMLPLAFLGKMTVQRKPWAIPAGLFWSTLGCLTALTPLFTGPMLFKVLYEDKEAFVVLAMHVLIAIPYVICFLLYLCAYLGKRRRDKEMALAAE